MSSSSVSATPFAAAGWLDACAPRCAGGSRWRSGAPARGGADAAAATHVRVGREDTAVRGLSRVGALACMPLCRPLQTGSTPLHVAAHCGQAEAAQVRPLRGVLVHSGMQSAAVQYGRAGNRPTPLQVLVAAGAPLNPQDQVRACVLPPCPSPPGVPVPGPSCAAGGLVAAAQGRIPLPRGDCRLSIGGWGRPGDSYRGGGARPCSAS